MAPPIILFEIWVRSCSGSRSMRRDTPPVDMSLLQPSNRCRSSKDIQECGPHTGADLYRVRVVSLYRTVPMMVSSSPESSIRKEHSVPLGIFRSISNVIRSESASNAAPKRSPTDFAVQTSVAENYPRTFTKVLQNIQYESMFFTQRTNASTTNGFAARPKTMPVMRSLATQANNESPKYKNPD